MVSLRVLRGAVVASAFLIAFIHGLYVHPAFMFSLIGGYFLVATVLFAVGGLLVWFGSGRLFKVGALGLILMAILDNSLIFYTRTLPSVFFRGRILRWSMEWYPPGTVQFFVAQLILIILAVLLLRNSES